MPERLAWQHAIWESTANCKYIGFGEASGSWLFDGSFFKNVFVNNCQASGQNLGHDSGRFYSCQFLIQALKGKIQFLVIDSQLVQ